MASKLLLELAKSRRASSILGDDLLRSGPQHACTMSPSTSTALRGNLLPPPARTRLASRRAILRVQTYSTPLQADDAALRRGQSPCGISRIDNLGSKFDDAAIVKLGMIRENHDAVSGGKAFCGQLDRSQRETVNLDRGDVGIGVLDLSPSLPQAIEHIEGGRLPRVRDAALICHAEDKDTGPVEAPVPLIADSEPRQ